MASIEGTQGPDTLFGTSGNDDINPHAGDDIVYAGGGNDEVHGITGDDRIYGEAGNDLLYGSDGDDWLYGGSGKDKIHGTHGTDHIWGGTGDDLLFGGKDGNDVIYGEAGNDRIWGGGLKNHPSEVQYQYGGTGNDHVGGDRGTDYGYGESGNDIVWGGRDNDFSYGGAGKDSVHGNIGNDHIYGGKGKDNMLGGKGDDYVYAEGGKDYASGNNGDDVVYGGGGNDTLRGGGGNDILLPGGGRNDMQGGGGKDTLSYADTDKGVIVDLGAKVFKKAAKGDSARKVENLVGSQSKDKLTPENKGSAFGEGGNDVLRSSKGAVLRGDEGMDKLHGDKNGKHKDVFWLQALDAEGDKIFKFKGKDKLKIDGSDFGLGGSLDGSELVNRSSGHAATAAKDQLIYDQSTKTLWLDHDGTGPGGAIKIATFKGGPGSLSTGDFDVV